ncbi:MAG: DUF2460 domain-containing protein [Rickettsiales bacterium]|jgi:uncharacterized protein (TIGR02217 family)|nr:DUF2460 domain-containing protein [Rickettsiales bacterium]
MFYETRFPEEISIRSKTSIEFDTNIVSCKNGREQRTPNKQPRMVYDVFIDIRAKKEIDMLIDFFRMVKGRCIGFRYKDWLDFSAEKQVIAKADGTAKHFQLIRGYASLSNGKSRLREITKPVEGTVRVFINNGEVNSFGVNYSKGEIILPSAPEKNSLVKASFEFDVPARFDTDILEISMHNAQSGEVKNLRIVEINEL